MILILIAGGVALYFVLTIPKAHQAHKLAEQARQQNQPQRAAEYSILENGAFAGVIILIIVLALLAPYLEP